MEVRSRPPLSDLAEFLAAIRRHWGQAVTGGTAVALLALAQQWFTLQGDAGKKIVSALPAVAIAWFVIAVPVACFLAWRDKHYELRAVEAGRDAALRDCDLARKELADLRATQQPQVIANIVQVDFDALTDGSDFFCIATIELGNKGADTGITGFTAAAKNHAGVPANAVGAVPRQPFKITHADSSTTVYDRAEFLGVQVIELRRNIPVCKAALVRFPGIPDDQGAKTVDISTLSFEIWDGSGGRWQTAPFEAVPISTRRYWPTS